METEAELASCCLDRVGRVGITAGASTPNWIIKRVFRELEKLPAGRLIGKLVFFSPQEAFLIYMRIAFLCGISVSMPVFFYQVWAFTSPAMDERLKSQAGFFVAFCSTTFVAGALFAYFVLIPPALKLLLSFGQGELEPMISATGYISFVASLTFACGLVFQMPIVSLILTKMGLVNSRTLRKKYKYAVVVIFIAAAMVTPTTDAFNMMLLALPMLLLYEASIWISAFAGRRAAGLVPKGKQA